MVVDVIQKILSLKPIFWAHFIQDKWLYSAFKFTNSENFRFDAYFFKEAF